MLLPNTACTYKLWRVFAIAVSFLDLHIQTSYDYRGIWSNWSWGCTFCTRRLAYNLHVGHVQPGAVKLVLWRHWMHLSYMHPVTPESQLHCTRLYAMYLASAPVVLRWNIHTSLPIAKRYSLSLAFRSCPWCLSFPGEDYTNFSEALRSILPSFLLLYGM